MFILVTLSDTLHLSPSSFSSPFQASLLSSIRGRYCNRVLPGHGLLLGPHTLLSHATPFLHPTDGGAHIRCSFTVICFAPSVGELLVGRIAACDSTGLLVSLGFYEWVLLPASELQQPSVWDDAERLWVWRYDGHELFMDIDQRIRVKVTAVSFSSRGSPQAELEEAEEAKERAATALAVASAAAGSSAAPGGAQGAQAAQSAQALAAAAAADSSKRKESIATYHPAMRVTATIKDDGLGLLAWWD